MNDRRIGALRDSIKHWRENLEAGPWKGDYSSGACALCALYLNSACYGCPVKEATGARYCFGTPYVKVAEIIRFADSYPSEQELKDAYDEACKAEIDFLERLLEKDLKPTRERKAYRSS